MHTSAVKAPWCLGPHSPLRALFKFKPIHKLIVASRADVIRDWAPCIERLTSIGMGPQIVSGDARAGIPNQATAETPDDSIVGIVA
jgi:hypothetical protein